MIPVGQTTLKHNYVDMGCKLSANVSILSKQILFTHTTVEDLDARCKGHDATLERI